MRACLAKDPDERIQTAHDVKLQLTWIAEAGSQPGVPRRVAGAPRAAARAARVGGRRVAVAAAAALRAGVVATGAVRGPAGAQVRFTIPVPRARSATVDLPRISPDGRTLAFSAQDSARPRHDLGAAAQLAGREPAPRHRGHAAGRSGRPTAATSASSPSGKLKKIAVAGGPPSVICDAPSGSDGTLGQERRDPVRRRRATRSDPARARGGRRAAAGDPASIRARGEIGLAGVPARRQALPLHDAAGAAGPAETSCSARWDSTRAVRSAITRLAGRVLARRATCCSRATRTLMAQRVRRRRAEAQGRARSRSRRPARGAATRRRNFSVSRTGVLVYRATGHGPSRLVWLDRTGRELGEIAARAGDYADPALSPDGTPHRDLGGVDGRRCRHRDRLDPRPAAAPRVHLRPGRRAGADLVARRHADRLRRRIGGTRCAATSAAARGGGHQLLARHRRSSGAARLVAATGGHRLHRARRPVTAMGHLGAAHGWRDSHAARPACRRRSTRGAHLSPDGRWIAYDSDESGRTEVYVSRSFGHGGQVADLEQRRRRRRGWSRDGQASSSTCRRTSSSCRCRDHRASRFTPGTPQLLFRVPTEASRRRNVYCAHARRATLPVPPAPRRNEHTDDRRDPRSAVRARSTS